MGARVRIVVCFPPSEPAVGAQVVGLNRSAWAGQEKMWRATTGHDGSYTWDNLDTGTLGDKWDFTAELTDKEGIDWMGFASERVKTPRTIPIPLPPWYHGEIRLSDALTESLSATEEGRIVLQGFAEIERALRNRLFQATVTLSTYLVEGMIHIKLRNQNKWGPGLEEKTYGWLINLDDVKQDIIPGLLNRLQGLGNFRKVSAHFKGRHTIDAEAQLAVRAVLDLAETWSRKLGASKG